MRAQRKAAAATIAGVALCAVLATYRDAPAQRAAPAAEDVPSPAADEASDEFRFVGTASCTAANCHGGDGSRPVRPGSDPFSPQAYSAWIERDPHAGAYDVLLNDLSQHIAARLNLPAAHTAPECLACHAVAAAERELAPGARHTLHDGVGCEACHGPAEAWLDAHKWAEWTALTPVQKALLGYRDMTDLGERTRVCAQCHVGAAGRDVNHDLIAAGHPRMAFEMSAYHANLPKHWKREATPADQLDARLWLVGQAVSAEMSLALLAERAANPAAPWPELAEYDCFACHHDLADPSWRQRDHRAVAGARPGAAPWGSWHFANLKRGLPGEGGAHASVVEAIAAEMQRPLPDRSRVAALAEDGALRLEELALALGVQPQRPVEPLAWIRRLTDPGELSSLARWDAAAQRYLGVAAMVYSARLAAGPNASAARLRWERIEAALERARAALEFPASALSPVDVAPLPDGADRRAAVRAAFEDIHRSVPAD